MAGVKSKSLPKGKSTVYVSLPSRRARSGGQMKTDDRVKASAEKTVRQALVEAKQPVRIPNTTVYVGGLIPTVHPEHVAKLFAGCGRIINIEYVCTRGTANLQDKPLPPVPADPLPGHLPTPRRTLRPRYLENPPLEQRQTWLYAIVRFDDTSSAARALAKNGVTLRGVEGTSCIAHVVSSSLDLEETRPPVDSPMRGMGRFPSCRGLVREATTEIDFKGRTQFSLVELAVRAQSRSLRKQLGNLSSTETIMKKATADRMKWLEAEATVRPSQRAAGMGWWEALNAGVNALCGISFRMTAA